MGKVIDEKERQKHCKGNWKLDLAKLAGGPKINIFTSVNSPSRRS